MSHNITLALSLSLLTLSACAVEPAEDSCVPTESSTYFGVTVDALMTKMEWSDDGSLMRADSQMMDCVTFTISDLNSDWEMSGMTPASFDVEPGDYLVEVDWEHNGVAYTSDPVTIEHTLEADVVMLALCADMSGDWTCSSHDEEWALEADALGGCGVDLWPLEESVRVRGHLVESENYDGNLDASGEELTLWHHDAPEEMIRCTKSE